jgi:hypothetical protein
MTDGSIVNLKWSDELLGPAGLIINESFIYVTNIGSSTISQINLIDGSMENPYWFTGPSESQPLFLLDYDSYLYASIIDIDASGIVKINLIQSIPIADVCFAAKTIIQTDQGYISIDKINPKTNTINKKPIIEITKTIGTDNFLICFEKHALSLNYPIEKTIVSKNHKIYYNGKMKEAYKFLERFDNVSKIKYNQEILYNILMKDYSTVIANNMVCETLHPNNIIAKLYNTNLGEDYKKKMILIMNNSIKKKDSCLYKDITNRL